MAAAGEPGDVADVGQDPGRDHGTDAVVVHQSRVALQHDGLEFGGGFLDLQIAHGVLEVLDLFLCGLDRNVTGAQQLLVGLFRAFQLLTVLSKFPPVGLQA